MVGHSPTNGLQWSNGNMRSPIWFLKFCTKYGRFENVGISEKSWSKDYIWPKYHVWNSKTTNKKIKQTKNSNKNFHNETPQ